MVAAMNHTDYAGSAACGACVRVEGPMGSVDVRIVDRCPECPQGDIDLSPEAFAFIADLSAGRVPISWQYIECPLTGSVVFHFKDGSNQWWTAVQMRNHRHPVAALAYDAGGGSFVDVPRLDYNYFVAETGMGPGPYTFRVTSAQGDVIEDPGIAHAENADVSGTTQFPACAAP
jgi:expansin (peptidoglycan-binding protein)